MFASFIRNGFLGFCSGWYFVNQSAAFVISGYIVKSFCHFYAPFLSHWDLQQLLWENQIRVFDIVAFGDNAKQNSLAQKVPRNNP